MRHQPGNRFRARSRYRHQFRRKSLRRSDAAAPKFNASALPEFGLVRISHSSRGHLRAANARRARLRASVVRSVIDHDDANLRIVGVQRRPDGAHDHFLFVVGGNQHRDVAACRSRPPRRAVNVPCAGGHRLRSGRRSNSRPVIRMSPRKNIQVIELDRRVEQPEANPIQPRRPAFVGRHRWHDVGTRLAQQFMRPEPTGTRARARPR